MEAIGIEVGILVWRWALICVTTLQLSTVNGHDLPRHLERYTSVNWQLVSGHKWLCVTMAPVFYLSLPPWSRRQVEPRPPNKDGPPVHPGPPQCP